MVKIDTEKIDLLLQYALVVAGQGSGWDRELGMIHLIKYVYLADLEYAEKHNGQLYTGIPWRFYHFGPWAEKVYLRIEPALMAIGAEKRIIPNPSDEKDVIRWIKSDDRLFDTLGNQLDLIVMGCIQKNVRRFGSDTTALLDFVYRTRPMVTAAPGEFLDFNILKSETISEEQIQARLAVKELTVRQKKKRKSALMDLKKRINARLDEKKNRPIAYSAPPRYDEIFFNGIKWLNSSSEEPLDSGEYTAIISDKMWKSKARYDPDLS
ncbi:MAG: hypothetical protein JRF56_04405 [Deltaproteobacteria bacterium]|nr:hypothetical protein [Deltaproteobacteria bacterium]